jgi:hypothetical protein
MENWECRILNFQFSIFNFQFSAMAYFSHAFKKVFVGSTFVTTGTTDTLTAGQFGFFDAKTFAAVNVAGATATAHPAVVLAAGSYHTVDKVGVHGGYKESLKSMVIRPRNIHRVWKLTAREATHSSVLVGWDAVNADTAPKFVCGRNYHLRVDLTGSPALRLLGRTAYHTFDVFTGCCSNVNSPEAVDPLYVLLQFAKQINDDPVFSKFILAVVIGGDGEEVVADGYVPLTDPGDIDAAIGTINLIGTYADTKFGNSSFDPLDHFELEPLVIKSAQLVDESGDPCSDFEQLTFTVAMTPAIGQGTGEQLLRELILSNSYRQEHYHTDPRLRTVEDMDFVHSVVDRNGLYDSYFILYSASRNSNPSGVYDNDQFLIQLSLPNQTNIASFESWVNSYLGSAGAGVTIENFLGE